MNKIRKFVNVFFLYSIRNSSCPFNTENILYVYIKDQDSNYSNPIFYLMKKLFHKKSFFSSALALLVLTLFVSSFVIKTDNGKVAMLTHKTFPKGEKISYLVHYGFIDAGEATVSIDEQNHYVNGNTCYRVDVHGKTVGVFGWTTKVDDLWRSYIHSETHTPQKFYRLIRENKYRKEEVINFDHQGRRAKVQTRKKAKDEWKSKEYQVPTDVQDMISGYYFLRRVDYSKLKKNDIVQMDAFMEDTVYNFKVRFLGEDEIRTKIGKQKAYVMAPIMPDNKIFSGDDAIKFWMSADDRRIPLKIRAKMWIGAVEVDITDYKKN